MARATIHYTKRGRVINMSALASKHSTKPALAVGTALYNARGDLIDKGGKIILKTQEQIVAEFQRLKDLQNSDSVESFDVKDPNLKLENSQFEPVVVDGDGAESDEKQPATQQKRRKIVEAD